MIAYGICLSPSHLFHLVQVSSCIHVATNDIILFFFMAEWYSIVYIYYIFLIQSSVDGHLGCFHVLAVVNSAEHRSACVFLNESCLYICPAVELLDHMVGSSI